jgi:hypothetical protein
VEQLRLSESALTPLFLYESVYPVQLEQGLPTAHHLVVYFHALVGDPRSTTASAGDVLPLTASQQPVIQLQRSEVDAAAYSPSGFASP